MNITPINQSNNQKPNNIAFKSVIIFRDIYPNRSKMGIFVLNDDTKGLIQLAGLVRGKELVLGYSKNAEVLEEILENLGAAIKEETNMIKIRELMKSIYKEFKPKLEGWFEVPGKTMKILLPKDSLGSLQESIKKGKPKYFKIPSDSKCSSGILSIYEKN